MRRICLALILLLLSVPTFAAMQAKPVAWKVGKQPFSGFLVYDDASKEQRPGLLMVPDWYGVTSAAVDKAKQLAGDDYVILVVDMYGKKVRPKNDKAALAQVQKLYADIPTLRARITQAVEVLKAQVGNAPLDASRIGAFGYCFGGATVLELARSGAQLAGIVTFHGGLRAYGPKAEAVKTPLLILNGADDESTQPYVADLEKEMTAASADWQFVNFSGAVHCFALETANKPGCMYNQRAAKRAYKMMDNFFEERFGED